MNTISRIAATFLLLTVTALSSFAQSTDFSYQGSLKDGANPANGNYDFEFALFDALSAGTQLGTTLARNGVVVTNGVFSVQLDFGNQFPGANRFLDIRVRVAGAGGFTTLAPRQKLASSPYAVKSIASDTATNASTATSAATAANALQLGGVAANQYVLTGDPRMIDARNPLPGSGNYIQNQNAGPQSASNFNVSGTGSANIFNAGTQFNIGGSRIMSNPGTNNLFAGAGAGSAITTGAQNHFFGSNAGAATSTGGNNSFFGNSAGTNNTLGNSNSFFGGGAGVGNLTGSGNSFFGLNAGSSNVLGALNTIIGIGANVGADNLTNATAIGARAFVTQSNSLILGAIGGVNNCIPVSCDSVNVGIGTTAPIGNLHVSVPGSGSPISALTVDVGTFGTGTNAINSYFFKVRDLGLGGTPAFMIRGDGNVGIGTGTPSDRFHVVGSSTFSGNVNINATAGVAGDLNVGGSGVITGNLGVGIAPLSKLHVFGNGALRITADSDSNAGIGLSLNNQTKWSVATVSPGQFQIYNQVLNSNAVWIDIANNNVGIGTIPNDKLEVNGVIRLGAVGSAGGTQLCRNIQGQIANCSSSLRYKTNIGQFSQGMSFVNKLRPMSFDWKDGGMKDVGFGAEDVVKIDPRFVTYNDKGEVEGVKYDRMSVAFVNAFKEQQEQIESQKAEIESLKAIVCELKPSAAICKK